MQEQLLESPVISAETKSIAKIERDFRLFGYLDPLTRQEIIDEEKTHAVEILAPYARHSCVPREYYLHEGILVDNYGYSIEQVITSGVRDAEGKVSTGIVGSEKELRRRQIELQVLRTDILTLQINEACVEWSTADNSWTEEERLAHGYTDRTHARVTTRVSKDKFLQFNVILPHNNLGAINHCRRLIDPSAQPLSSAEQILASPQRLNFENNDPVKFVDFIESEFGNSLLANNLPQAVVSIFRKYIKRRKSTKEFVFDQEDIFGAMIASFEDAARNDIEDWRSMSEQIRGGTWQMLIERYEGKKVGRSQADSGSINAAAQRAADAGTAFTACGGTIDMGSQSAGTVASVFDRLNTVRVLLSTEVGFGVCGSCGSSGSLTGCGVFCRSCNEIWCDEYLITGQQLEPHEIVLRKYFSYSRGGLGFGR